MNWSITEDILPWLAFTTAVVMILLVPVRPRGAFSMGAKWFFVAALACYMVGTAWSILGHFIVRPIFLNSIIDVMEDLLVPFMLFGIYSLYARQQLNDALAAGDAVTRTADMMASIVATAPAGIVVLDDVGRITFANDAARGLLDLNDDPDLVTLKAPGWTVRVGDKRPAGEPRADFADLVSDEPASDVMVVVEWPTGWRRRLSVNVEPMKSADGRVTGAIVAFIEREPWRTAAH